MSVYAALKGYSSLVTEYRHCWFCGKMIVKEATLALIDNTEREFCDSDCVDFYAWYQEKCAKYKLNE